MLGENQPDAAKNDIAFAMRAIRAYRSIDAHGSGLLAQVLNALVEPEKSAEIADSQSWNMVALLKEAQDNHWRLNYGLLSVINELLHLRQVEADAEPEQTLAFLDEIHRTIGGPISPPSALD